MKLLSEIDAYARGKDERVRQVMASLTGEWQAVQIIRAGGERVADIRPLVRLNVSIVVEQDGRMETGGHGAGGRTSYESYIDPASWRRQVDEALRQALVNLESVPAPAGEMQVVLGSGWPGILSYTKRSGMAWKGISTARRRPPSPASWVNVSHHRGVTVVDDGTMADRRGSLTVDDEGTPGQRTVLIEDGILTGYMQDRQNARLMGMSATGNGRRQSYAHIPMPRMTNTVMLAGDHAPEEILKSVKSGIYAVNFGGGQVDITNGKFVFSCNEAYHIEDGKVGAPVKSATLIGNGPDVLTKVAMIGDDMALDDGIGTCGKEGQGVPVGVGQPTMRIDGLTVGGTGGVGSHKTVGKRRPARVYKI